MKKLLYCLLFLPVCAFCAAPDSQTAADPAAKRQQDVKNAQAGLANFRNQPEKAGQYIEDLVAKTDDPDTKGQILALYLRQCRMSAEILGTLDKALALPGIGNETRAKLYSGAFGAVDRAAEPRKNIRESVLDRVKADPRLTETEKFALSLEYFSCDRKSHPAEETYARIAAMKIPADLGTGLFKLYASLRCEYAVKTSRWMGTVSPQGYRNAIEAADMLLAKIPGEPDFTVRKATCLLALDRPDEALALAEQMLSAGRNMDRFKVAMLSLKGEILMKKEDWAGAYDAFQQVPEKMRRGDIRVKMAECCMAQGKYADAAKHLEAHIAAGGKAAARKYESALRHLKQIQEKK